MRNILILLFVTLLYSCTSLSKYQINGVVSNDMLEGKAVYISKYIGRELINIDSTIIREGKFVFDGRQDTAVLRVLRVDDERADKLAFILENGSIYATLDTVSVAEGTPLNDTLVAYQKAISKYELKYESTSAKVERLTIENQLSDSLNTQLNVELKQIESTMQDISVAIIHRNINNEAGAYIFWLNRGTFTPELQKTILYKAGETFKAEPFVKIIIQRLEMMKQVLIGNKYVNLTMKNTNDQTVSLSDFVGKGNYVLIDFWASWCPSCRKEMPSLVNIYSKFKGKGFEIVGVSFDKQKAAWINGIETLGMTWPQMSDLKFWSSAGATQYAVRAIPHSVLLDPNGIIVAKDLDAVELNKNLIEYLK